MTNGNRSSACAGQRLEVKQIMKKYRKYVAKFLILILLINAVSPLFFSFGNVAISVNGTIEELFSDKVLICTSSGFKYISREDFESGNYPEDSREPHCPLCIISAVSAKKFVKTSNVIALIVPPNVLKSYFDSGEHIVIGYIFLNSNTQRAPPIYSFS